MAESPSAAVQPAPGDVVVGSLSQARKHKRCFDAVITLEDPACRPSNRLRFTRHPAPAHLVLAFEDVDDDTLGVRVAKGPSGVYMSRLPIEQVRDCLIVEMTDGIGGMTTRQIVRMIIVARWKKSREAKLAGPDFTPGRRVLLSAEVDQKAYRTPTVGAVLLSA